MLKSKRFTTRQGLIVGLLAGALAVTAPAMAQQNGNGEGNGGGQAAQQKAAQQGGKLVESRLKVRKLSQKLSKIRQSAIKNNPDLAKQRDALRQSVNDSIRSSGVDPKKDVARLREIAKKLRAGDVKGEEQKALTKEYRKKREALLEARRKALSNEDIQASQKKFRDELLAAMKKEDPNTEDLIKQYNAAQRDLRKRMRDAAAAQKKGGGSGQPQGGGQ
ncbi:hypothetical protein KBTX_01044 [wastewater metagenome]|uniref:Uncharacterized protein n=3 Tax=root TaxID=1 RepID=A0A5B8R7P8_9ZZZZ|nr:hypothetical protein [Arhodomonas aquaeolei]MCS4503200.1 hypothetical protein [Arhodomonas aquaeolei]QEA04736.1 hypothetical protein KBTEX_01044 [uncultured organism]